MRSMPMFRCTYRSLGFLLILAILVLSGCEGDPGKDGVGVEFPDTAPPVISLLYPKPNTNIYDDSLLVVVDAYDEDGEVEYVEFYLNSNSHLTESDSAILFEAPYQFRWPLSLLRNHGMFTVSALASDTVGNRNRTPELVLYYKEATGTDTLSNFNIGNGQYFIPLPSDGPESNPDVEFTHYAVRFEMPADCELLGAQYEFYAPSAADTTIATVNAVHFHLWDMDEITFLPGEILFEPDSMIASQIDMTTLTRIEWTYVSLDTVEIDTVEGYLPFEAGETFYLGFHAYSPNDTTGAIIRTHINRDVLPTEQLEHSYARIQNTESTETQWGRLSELRDTDIWEEFHIRCIVQFSGNEGLYSVTPDGQVEQIQ